MNLLSTYVSSGADISPDNRYRFKLWREWRGTHNPKHWRWLEVNDGAGAPMGEPKSVLFVMLNPSTADEKKDDATIRRCVAFTKHWEYELLEVVNLWPLRTRHPRVLFSVSEDERSHWRSQEVIEKAAMRAGLIICAWGAHPQIDHQGDVVRGWMLDYDCYALGFSRSGAPRHPLYVHSNAELVRMK